MTAKSLFTVGFGDFQKTLEDLGMPAFRAKQVQEWIFRKFVFTFDEMTNLSLADREKLKAAFPKILPPVEKYLQDHDGTSKVVVKLADDELVEAVAIPDEESLTFCLSTQVGCAVGCVFCRTGEMGFKRNLSSDEIMLQVMLLVKRTGKRPTNIVFMGMGEPFFNRAALYEAIDMLTDPLGLGLATRRITISTSGVIEGITELAGRPGEVNLAVSLHVADNATRTNLVPINKRYPLDKLKDAISAYCAHTSRRVTLEVVLLKNINDQLQDAMNLVSFCEGLIVHVNVVRFNHFPGSPYEPSPLKDEKEFRKILKKAGIAVTVRKSRGQEIMAACGQLAGKSDDQEKSDSCLAILIKMTVLMSILIAVLVGGVYFAYNKLNEFFNRGGTVIVPDFRDKHIVEVMKTKPAGLEVVRRDEKFDDRHAKDHVIAQFPEPGTVVKPGKQVLVSISLGLQKVNVPELVGSSMREVDVSLMNSQLSIGDRAYVFSEKVAPDRIVGQSPLPAEEYGVNKEVDLLVSLGRKPEVLILPNLTAVSLDDAKNRLKAWGLNFGRIYSRPDSGRAKFQIISTSPSPYSHLRRGEVVSLLVSSGSDEGTATPADLKKFEVFAGFDAVKPVEAKPVPAAPGVTQTPPVAATDVSPAPAQVPAPPRVIVAGEENVIEATPAVQSPPRILAPVVDREMSFVMPDGFMPKEVKFIHITPDGRQQVYAGAHKPLELVKVKVPVVPNSKIQIYINDVPVEERRVEP